MKKHSDFKIQHIDFVDCLMTVKYNDIDSLCDAMQIVPGELPFNPSVKQKKKKGALHYLKLLITNRRK